MSATPCYVVDRNLLIRSAISLIARVTAVWCLYECTACVKSRVCTSIAVGFVSYVSRPWCLITSMTVCCRVFPLYHLFLIITRIAEATCVLPCVSSWFWCSVRMFVIVHMMCNLRSCVITKRSFSSLVPRLYGVCMSVLHVSRPCVYSSCCRSVIVCLALFVHLYTLRCSLLFFVISFYSLTLLLMVLLPSHLCFTHSRYVTSACMCPLLICCFFESVYMKCDAHCETPNHP